MHKDSLLTFYLDSLDLVLWGYAQKDVHKNKPQAIQKQGLD